MNSVKLPCFFIIFFSFNFNFQKEPLKCKSAVSEFLEKSKRVLTLKNAQMSLREYLESTQTGIRKYLESTWKVLEYFWKLYESKHQQFLIFNRKIFSFGKFECSHFHRNFQFINKSLIKENRFKNAILSKKEEESGPQRLGLSWTIFSELDPGPGFESGIN